MAKTSVQLNLPPALVNSVVQEGQSLDLEGQQSLTALLAAAVDAARMSEKEAARDMGYDPAYWSRIKAGEKAAHLERLGRLPELAQREFVTRYAQQLRMTVGHEDRRKALIADLVEAAARALREIA